MYDRAVQWLPPQSLLSRTVTFRVLAFFENLAVTAESLAVKFNGTSKLSPSGDVMRTTAEPPTPLLPT